MIRYNLGILAEYCVLIYYLIRFYQPLHHRYKSYVGEVDLIMKRGNQLVFIEVKARKNGLHEALVSKNQQQVFKDLLFMYHFLVSQIFTSIMPT